LPVSATELKKRQRRGAIVLFMLLTFREREIKKQLKPNRKQKEERETASRREKAQAKSMTAASAPAFHA